MEKQYYITTTRLTNNPRLWQTIQLMTSINPEARVYLPKPTRYWLREGAPQHWTTISPENVVLCMKYAEGSLRIEFPSYKDQGEKVLDLLLQTDDLYEHALGNAVTKRTSIDKFLKEKLKPLADAAAADVAKTASTPWKASLKKVSTLENAISNILYNPSLSTYQIQLIWDAVSSKELIAESLIERCALDKIPDYIFKELLTSIVLKKPSYDYGSRKYSFFVEAMRRNMLVRVEPSGVTIQPEAYPTESPIEVANGQEVQQEKGSASPIPA